MNSLTEEELDSLPLKELIQRMDDFLLESNKERYGQLHLGFTIPLPSDLINTISVQGKTESEIRKIAYLVFSYLVQLELFSVSSGISNKILFTKNYKPLDWTSPTFRLRSSSINQYQIICSRIAFEIFIDLLYCIENGERLASKKSKLKKFRAWLQDVNNRFHYFAHVLLIAYRFDREIRTPEVHGSSSSPRNMLMLQIPTSEEMNKQFRLTNTLVNVWQSLIDILNNTRPTYMNIITPADNEWFQVYMSGNDEAIEAKLDEMLGSVENDGI